MCRFLLLKSKKPVNPQSFLNEFAIMAEKSKATDGDWQGDGWGFSWLDKNNKWQLYKSLKPIWKDIQSFNLPAGRHGRFSMTKMFAIHARSATFPQHKNNIDFNQPYLNGKYAFVFNGYLKGVTLSIPGKIGAEKIWCLLQKTLKEKKPVEALEKVKNILKKNTKSIQALNIGFSDGKKIYALSYYSNHPEYYRLRYLKTRELSLISSEPIGEYNFSKTTSGSILSF